MSLLHSTLKTSLVSISATAAVAFLSLSVFAAPAQATNSDSTIDQPPALAGRAPSIQIISDDNLTTGSIGIRSRVSSAQEGNAEQTNFAVPQYGQTSGGHAR